MKGFMVAKWNVRNPSESSRIEQVRKEMVHYVIDVLGLSEIN